MNVPARPVQPGGTWLRTGLGISQLTVGTWLLVAWLIGAPMWLVLSLVAASATLLVARWVFQRLEVRL